MNKDTSIGLVGGVLLGESLKEITTQLLVQPFFGASPGVGAWLLIAVVTLVILSQVTDKYSD